jgi:pyrroline-5-carboxylate reductase
MIKNIGFIGAGNMAYALAQAIIEQESAVQVNVFDIRPERMDLFAGGFPGVKLKKGNRDLASASEVIFIAVKPQEIDMVLKEIVGTKKLVISIAAGITIKHLESSLPHARIFRVMPNTPCLVGEMAAGFAAGSRSTTGDVELVQMLLSCAGYAVKVKEEQLDAVTGLSGSGPAFIAYLAEAFISAGTGLGLSEKTARELTLKTIRGTSLLLEKSRMSPRELINMVSSPRGTTVAGREILESSDCSEIISKTVAAAAARSKELGR